jgi:hypothetical protein
MQVVSFVSKQRIRWNRMGLTPGMSATFGGLSQILDLFKLGRMLSAGEWDEFSPFLLGEPVVDSRSQRITAVMSCEELLLNAYRNQRSGQRPWVSCDCTYRVSSDEHTGFLIIGTGDIGQHFHLISLAVINREDTKAHLVAVRQTRTAVEAAVRSRARRQLRV